MGLHRRFYDTNWQQESAHCATGPGLGLTHRFPVALEKLLAVRQSGGFSEPGVSQLQMPLTS